MRGLDPTSTGDYLAATAAIDAANSADPTLVVVRGEVYPLALVHGRLAAHWAARLSSPWQTLEGSGVGVPGVRGSGVEGFEVGGSGVEGFEVGGSGVEGFEVGGPGAEKIDAATPVDSAVLADRQLADGGRRFDGEAVLLAARAHHLRRWELPRGAYPEGKAGYHQWKRDQRLRHARDVEQILVDTGYGEADIARVQAYIRRDNLAASGGSQIVEDAACLVFLETQLAGVAQRLDRGHLIEVLRRAARKMSSHGLALTGQLPLGDERALLDEALAG